MQEPLAELQLADHEGLGAREHAQVELDGNPVEMQRPCFDNNPICQQCHFTCCATLARIRRRNARKSILLISRLLKCRGFRDILHESLAHCEADICRIHTAFRVKGEFAEDTSYKLVIGHGCRLQCRDKFVEMRINLMNQSGYRSFARSAHSILSLYKWTCSYLSTVKNTASSWSNNLCWFEVGPSFQLGGPPHNIMGALRLIMCKVSALTLPQSSLAARSKNG